MEGHENKGAITKPICNPDKKCEKPEEVIPKSKTKAQAVMPQLTSCDQTPELTTVGANAQLSTRAGRAALLWQTLQQAGVLVHVPSVAGVVGKHSPWSNLVAAEVAGAHTTGRADTVLLPVGGHLSDLDPQGLGTLQKEAKGLGQRLAQEVEKREENKRSRKKDRRRK